MKTTAVCATNQAIIFFNTLCCLISNTSKNDSVAGRAKSSKNLLTKLLFVLQVVHFFDNLDKTFTKIPIKNFKSFVSSQNKQDLIKTFKSKRDYVRICKILARV